MLFCRSLVGVVLLSLSLSALAVAKAGAIKVGAVFPMTGPIATYGQESVNGMKLALEVINQKKIDGDTIELLVEDNKGEPIETANAVRKLINIDNVKTVLGSVASSNTLAGAPIAQSAKVPLLTPASTNETVTEKGEYVSRTCFTDNFQGAVMAKFAATSLKKKRAAIIIDNSSDYSKGLSGAFRQAFKKAGGKIVTEESYVQKDTDFRTMLRRVNRKKPDVIFLPGYYTEVGNILRQARQMKMQQPFLGGDGWDSPKLQELAGKEGIKGNYLSSHFAPDDTDPRVQEFVKKYKKQFGARPGAMAALGYDAIFVLADALKRAKKRDHVSIKEAINHTKNFVGVTGTISLDANRNAVKSAVVLETTAKGNIFKQKVNP